MSNKREDRRTWIRPEVGSSALPGDDRTFIPAAGTDGIDGATQIGARAETDSFSRYEFSGSGAEIVQHSRIGDFEVTSVLGRGGMGVVYQARHRTLKRDVAVKMMLAGSSASHDQKQRFLAEARAVAHLQHPNIVQIFEVGQHDGMPYFALELVDGLTLDRQLKNRTLTERDAATLLQILCTALQYAHDQGILHRDLKPANILMTADGRPKVTDFGLARKIEEEAEQSSRTQVGTIMGTPSYMSPEQARGDVHLLTPATDQYSLGAILYEMLTGRPPFIGARPVDTVLQVLNKDPIAPRELQPYLSVDLETICLKALQKDCEKRYESCSRMAEDLGRFLRSEPILARPVGRVERLWRWCRRNPLIAIPSVLAVVSLISVAGVSAWSAWTLSEKNVELTQRSERLQQFVQTMYGELRDFNVDEAPRVKPARDRMLNSFNEMMLQVVEELPREGQAEAVYAAVKMGLVESLIDQQKTDEAEKILSELQTIYERRVILKQGSDAARNNLALLYQHVGNLKRDLRRDLSASLSAHQQALGIAEDILQHPKAAGDGLGRLRSCEAHSLCAEAHADLGATYYRTGDPHQALVHMEKSLKLWEEALRLFDQDPELAAWPADERASERQFYEVSLQQRRLSSAAALFRSGRAKEAEPLFRHSFETASFNLKQDPRNPRLRHEFVGQAGLWAEFLGFSGREREALDVLEESASCLDDLLFDDPDRVAFQRTVTVALYRLAQWRKKLQSGDASGALEQCLGIRRELAKAEPGNDRRQLDLMLALSRSGFAADARPLIERYRNYPIPDPEMFIEVARSLAQLSEHAGNEEERRELIRQSIESIRKAMAGGFRDAVYLNGEPDFIPLRKEPDFQSLSRNG